MSYDELELDTLGDRKTALFLIMSDTDDTFNFVIAILQSQLFNLLCDKADDEYNGKLPIHVRFLLDEFANIGQIPRFDKLIATIRSREMSASTSIDVTTVITDIEAKLEAMSVGGLLGLWFQSLFVGLTMKALSICIMLVVYGRMIEIYLVTSVAPIPIELYALAEILGVSADELLGRTSV